MKTKRGLQLDRVVLLGRTFEEYRRYFLLDPDRLIGKRVLDVAGGVSSFCAEGSKLGIKVTAFDPIHRDSVSEIMRVTRGEARIYPTMTFEAQPSQCCDPTRHCDSFLSRKSKPISSFS